MCRKLRFLIFLLTASYALPVHAAAYQLAQKNKRFSTTVLTIKVGDTVSFKNEDPFPHNVFSLSDTKTFDLGSYPKGQSKTIVFDKPGTVEVECAIHPAMKLIIQVKT